MSQKSSKGLLIVTVILLFASVGGNVYLAKQLSAQTAQLEELAKKEEKRAKKEKAELDAKAELGRAIMEMRYGNL